ncbi:unnamed protein product, partial [Chrysoparadoxa australica]
GKGGCKEERARLACSYQNMLEEVMASDTMQRRAQASSWQLSSWVGLGCHKLAQQALRSFTSLRQDPDDSRKIMWESRSCAE